jgi:streptogrisin D
MRRGIQLAFIGATAVALTVAATPAWSAPTPGGGPLGNRQQISADKLNLSAVEREQAPLVGLSYQIREAVKRNHWSDYTGISVDVPSHVVKLYWKGTPPAALRAGLRIPKDVKLADVAVPYSLAQLDQEERRVMDANPTTVAGVALRADYAGLEIRLDRAAGDVAALARTITSSIPLTFTGGTRPTAGTYRFDDAMPFWAGGAYRRPTGGNMYLWCTAGFGGHTWDGQNVNVTAGHCGTNADLQTGTGFRFGHSNGGFMAMDSMLVSGGEYDSAMYNGPWNSNTGVPIYGANNPPLNSFVVSSGSWSGASVVQVTVVNTYVNVRDVGRVGPVFQTHEPNGQPTIGQGDSGGPVTQTVSLPDGSLAVLAGGIFSAFEDIASGDQCQGLHDPGRHCGANAFHVQIMDVMSHWGVTIGVTSPPI